MRKKKLIATRNGLIGKKGIFEIIFFIGEKIIWFDVFPCGH